MLTGTGREELLKLLYRRDAHQISLSVTHQTAIATTNNAERITSTILILVHRLCLVYSRNRVREIKVRLKHPCLHPNNPVDVESGNRSEEHTSELQSRENLVCRLLLEKKNIITIR